MSKERARARAAREHEAALRTAARAAGAERRERRAARTRALRRAAGAPRRRPVGRATGTLARRRQRRLAAVFAVLVAVNIAVWVVRPDWASRLAIVVLTLLAAPLLVVLAPGRR